MTDASPPSRSAAAGPPAEAPEDTSRRAADAQLAAALAVAQLGAFVWEVETNRVTFDARSRAIFGFGTTEPVTAEDVFGRIHPADLDRVVAEAFTSQRDRTRLETEYRIVWPDGTERFIHSTNEALLGADGRPERMIGVFADVTDQRRTQEALRQSEGRYRALFESLDEGFCIIELLFDAAGRAADYRFLEMNASYARHTGLTDVLGKTARELAPDLEQYWYDTYGGVARTGEPVRFEQYAAALGRWFSLYAFRVGEPEARQVAVLFTDVTARRQAEATLLANEARLAAIFGQAAVGLSEVSPEGRFLRANDELCRMLGRPQEELLQLALPDVTYPDDVLPSWELVRHVLANGGPLALDKRYRRPDGAVVWASSTATRLRGSGNLLIVTTDLTARRRAEEALRRDEERQAFLLRLSDRLRPLHDPAAVQYAAACALGEHLGADRVGYAEDQDDGLTVVVTRNFTRGVPGIEGRYRYEDYGPTLMPDLRAGRTVVRPDIAADPTLSADEKAAHAALQLGATVNVPLVKEGALVAILFVHFRERHDWTPDELALIREVAERTWAAVVRARAEDALRRREERQSFLLHFSDTIRHLTDAAEVQQQAAHLLGDYLSADRVGYAEDQADGTLVVYRDYARHLPSLTGRYRYEDYGRDLVDRLWAGQTVVRADVAHDPGLTAAEKVAYADLRIGANVNLPLIKAGRLVATMYVAFVGPHHWTPDELALLHEAADRIWEAVERTRAETALRRSEERLRLALDVAELGTWAWDLVTGTGELDARSAAMMGLPSGPITDVLDAQRAAILPADQKRIAGDIAAGVAGRVPFSLDYRVMHPDGAVHHVVSRVHVVTDAADRPVQLVGTNRDATAEREAAQRLQDTNNQLTRANVDLDNFIYAASHDLKVPIANIEGLLQALHEQLPAPVQDTYAVAPLLAMMQESVERFQRTLEHLSDVVRLQKEFEQPATPVALAPVIEDVRRDIASLIRQTAARVEVDIAACPAIRVAANNLRSVVYNLLSNALKYHHPARPALVQVRCRTDAEYAVLEVTDNGLGVEAGREQEVFTMFRRLHSHVEGSGVGLFMVKRIVENGGGRVEIESTAGVGTTFRVFFPR